MRSVCAQPARGGLKDVLTSVHKEGGTRALYRGIGEYMLFFFQCVLENLVTWGLDLGEVKEVQYWLKGLESAVMSLILLSTILWSVLGLVRPNLLLA